MEELIIQYLIGREAPEGIAGEMEVRALKLAELLDFQNRLLYKIPEETWKAVIKIVVASPVFLPENYLEETKEGFLTKVILTRLEYLERFVLRPIEFEAKKEEDFEAYDKIRQVEEARVYFSQIRQALEGRKIKVVFGGTIDKEGRSTPNYSEDSSLEARQPAQQEARTKALALRIYFLYWAGHLPELDKGKKKALAALAEKEGVSPGSLINAFYAMKKNSDKNPLKIHILEQVLPTLEGFPEALKLAKDELERLKKKSNPRK